MPDTRTHAGSGGPVYPGTRWSLVQRLVEPASRIGTATRRRAFEELALAYWRPVYRTLRVAHHKSREESEDLTQAFLLELFEKGKLAAFEADPDAGKFRSLLRALLDSFVRTAARDSRRKKRGGDRRRVNLDAGELEALEERIAREPAADPFELEWRASLLETALAALEHDATTPLWRRRFEVFLAHDVALESETPPSYADLARRFGLAPHDVKNDLTAVRRRFAELVLDRIRDDCRSEAEAQRELRALFGEASP